MQDMGVTKPDILHWDRLDYMSKVKAALHAGALAAGIGASALRGGTTLTGQV
jgi:hypothetical protein